MYLGKSEKIEMEKYLFTTIDEKYEKIIEIISK